MKLRKLTLVLAFAATLIASFAAGAQDLDELTAAKRAARRNMTIKEWNTDAKSKTRWLDRQTSYDSEGRKVEEIEFTQYGQKWRETYQYGENDRIAKEVVYDEKNKPTLIRKYEYSADGRKAKQYNYLPNGKLQTIKVFEYIMD